MNYRHQFHAGNFADVVKHALLIRLVRRLQQKPKGMLFLDSHAGRGRYDLTAEALGNSLERAPEWPAGIGRLWERRDLPMPLADYLELVRGFDREQGNLAPDVRFYPGSPWIAARIAREQDRLAFCEKHPLEFAALDAEFGASRTSGDRPGRTAVGRTRCRVSVQEMDGYVALRAMLPPPERRGLVLIDPPYEVQDEFALATEALDDGLRRFRSGVFAVWYPLTERARATEFFAAIGSLRPPPTLALELAIAGDDSARKMKGCGVVVVNPPWQFDQEAATILNYLAPVLAQGPGGGTRVTWLVPEG